MKSHKSMTAALSLLLSFFILTLPLASCAWPPSNASWTVHRGIPENQGINPGSSSPVTSHELWNNSTAGIFTCDPVAANVTYGYLFVPPIPHKNVVYVGMANTIVVYDAWTGFRLNTAVNPTYGNVNQIIVDDPFIIVKTDKYIMGYSTDITWRYWIYSSPIYKTLAHRGERIGHITPGLNRLQLVQHQVIVGIVNASDANYTPEGGYSGHRAFRADYDIGNLSVIWHRDLNSEVENTPAIYQNISSGYGGNNTTVGNGKDIPGYGHFVSLPPDFSPLNVGYKSAIFLTDKNWLYCLLASAGTPSIIQDAVAHNASLTNPRWVEPVFNFNTVTSPVVIYHFKTQGNNSFSGGDGTWNGGQWCTCDAVFFLTSDGYGNGICLKDHTNLHRGWYIWNQLSINFTGSHNPWFQSYAGDESLNAYNDNPSFNESWLYVGNGIGVFYKIRISDGLITGWRAFAGSWYFCIDSPAFNRGRIYVEMHKSDGNLKLEVITKLGLNTIWNREYTPPVPASNTTGFWNPEPCVAFDTVFVCAYGLVNPGIWAQRDNEPPYVNCGETVVHPTIGIPYTFHNATYGDHDGRIVNITWDFHWGQRYTGICTFTFWANVSDTCYLTVTDDDGATAVDSFTVNPHPPPAPIANITWSGHIDIFNNTDTFNSVHSTGTNITWWNWSVHRPDGSYYHDNGVDHAITYTFTTAARWYNVSLRLEDQWGQVGRKFVLVYVYLPNPPTAVISYDGWAVVNETEQFNGTSRGTNITYWNWSVEHNGTIQWYDNGTTILFTYVFTEVHQIYNVTLNVTDQWGQSDRTTLSVFTHYTASPDINWTNKPIVGFVGKSLSYSFTTQNISLVVWTWGDGKTSTGTTGNMTHTWHKWGTFNVTMTIYNIHGDSNSSSFQVNIGIFDWNSFLHVLWWILIIIVIVLIIRTVVKFMQSRGENNIDI